MSKLRILPQMAGKHTGTPDSQDATYATLEARGGYTWNSNVVPPPAATISIPDFSLLACYTPLSNSAPTIASGAFGVVTFDTLSAGFPFRPGDVVLGGHMANLAPNSSEVYAADPLEGLGSAPRLFVVSWSISGGTNPATNAPQLNALVYNASGGSLTVSASWLPPIYILRLGA